MDVNEFASRLERLERDNRRMKQTALALVGAGLAVAMIGATTAEEIPEVIEAREFRVLGEKGEERAQMSADGISYGDKDGRPLARIDAVGIGRFDENGKLRVLMTADGFAYYDENGRVRAEMNDDSIKYHDESGQFSAAMSADGLTYADENGKTRAAISADEISYSDANGQKRVLLRAEGIGYNDENGHERAVVGVVEFPTFGRYAEWFEPEKRSGPRARYTAGVALFDEDDEVIWLAPSAAVLAPLPED